MSLDAPFRRAFDAARDPYTARNALGITTTGGGGGAPIGAEYITSSTDATLTNERVLTDTPSITWDFTTPGQAKASTTAGGGNVSNSGTPTSGQYAKWVTATTIQGVAPATVLSDIGAQPAGSYQPLDADLTALAALAGTNTIYYRSASNVWSPVNVSTGLSFSGGNLTATSAGGNVSNSGTPVAGQVALWTDATHIQGVSSASDQTTARSNIYAAPFDALAYNGLQMNGSCEVSQERGSAGFTAPSATSIYIQDGWGFFHATAPLAMGAFPQRADGPAGFANCTAANVTTGKAVLGASDQVFFQQTIEGYRIRRLSWGTANAQSLSIGFWVKTTIAGTMAVSLIGGGGSLRTYISNVVINAANTWEYKTLTIPGDTAGTWANDNTAGLIVRLCFGAGSSVQAPSTGSWLAGGFSGSSATTNFVATASNLISITGLIVLPGIELPSAARSAFIMRPYDQELMMCKRYFYNGVPPLRGVTAAAAAASRVACLHPVEMRATPTLTISAALPIYDGVTVTTITSIGSNFTTTTVVEFEANTAAAFGGGRPAMVYQGAGGNLNVDARL